MNMMHHTKTLGVVEVEKTVWKKLTDEEKRHIEAVCDAKLAAYYSR